MIATVLSFPGFYNSMLSQGLDNAEEQAGESIAENHGLDTGKVAEAFYDNSDYQAGFLYIAECCVTFLNDKVLADTGIVLTFESMDSPREYNFTTDRLFVKVNDPARLLLLTEHDRFAATIRDHFTSYDGFISSYSNDITRWLTKPLDQWDHNELGTLLQSYIDQRTEELDLDSDDLYEWLQEDFDAAVDRQTNWKALGEALGVEL